MNGKIRGRMLFLGVIYWGELARLLLAFKIKSMVIMKINTKEVKKIGS